MMPLLQPTLSVLVGLSFLRGDAASQWDRPMDFTAEMLKNGHLQGLQNVQKPMSLTLDTSLVKFEPNSLSLRNQPTCVPHWEQIEIVNIGDKEIVIEAVSSDHNMFHPSLSKPETLQPLERSKMQVLFLAQSVGQFEGLIFVQTNLGVIPFNVKASAIENSYKVEPIVGAKLVVGERFSPPVSLYNPHDVNLHVREVLTTEGFLHLALPDRPGESGGQSIERTADASNDAEASAAVWTVLPKQHKTIIHVSFVSHITGKFQGFVHLKTDIENLLVPVEIMVTKGGVHVTPEIVDFQTLVSPLQSRSIWLSLTNLNPQPIELLSLYDPKQDPNLQITGLDQKGINVVPGATARFAKVAYHGGEEGLMQGKLQLIINDTDSVSATLDIPYKARVLYGSLGFMNDKTKFQSTPGKVTSTMRSIMISNNFSVPIVIHNAKIDDPSFQISHFTPNSLLAPRDAVSLMHVEFTSNGTSALYTRDLELTTNVTAMKIPLQVYHGKLHCQVEHADLKECSSSDLDLDMGTISVSESRRKHINITNMNPVNVTIEYITLTHSTVNLYMDGVWGPKGEQVRGPRPVPRNLQSKRILTLLPGHRLALAVEVTAMEAGSTSAVITISTRRKENIVLPVRYESVLGSLAFLPATIRFEASFPGRVQSRIVAARSTFERPLRIHAVRSLDPRIIPELITRSLSPLARTEIAHIHYDPSKFSSPDENYMPQSDEVEWDVPLTEEIVERWAKRQKMWDELGVRGQTDIEATLLFDTNIVRGASLTVRAFLTKPCIVRESTLSFDLTQVGTSVTQMLVIHNPSDTLLAVQLVFPICEVIAEMNSTCDVGFRLAPQAQKVFYIKPHSDLPVGPIVFEPQQHTTYNTTLYVRNNLTMLHPVKLHGIGESGRLIFPNGSLDFNLTAADIGEEFVDDKGFSRQRIAISKNFVATNDCELPVEVVRMDINGIPGCSGFGFQIHDCRPFTVAPHETISFRVSFAPDSPASRWEQKLRLHTQSGILAVPLRAFVPPELLPQLADRAPFLGESEASVKKTITIISVVLCAVMFVVVVGDSMKVYRATVSNGSTSCRDSTARPCEMISLLSWPGVNSLAPSSLWSSSVRRDHLLGAQRNARRVQREEAQDPGHVQQTQSGDPHDRRGYRPNPPAPAPSKPASTERATDARQERDDDHKGATASGDVPKGGPNSPRPASKEETKQRSAEETDRKQSADAARAAAEEVSRRMREEERRKARDSEEGDKQAKSNADQTRKPVEEQRRQADKETQPATTHAHGQSQQKSDSTKGKKKGEKKDTTGTAAAKEPAKERRETAPAPEPPRPRAREEREKAVREERDRTTREERERHAREERERLAGEERERLAREEREKLVSEERERTAREEREKLSQEERERTSADDRERQAREEREKSNKDERERLREERERSAREDRDRVMREDREGTVHDERDWLPREDREKRDARERRPQGSEQQAPDRRGAQPEVQGASSKRKEVTYSKKKEAAVHTSAKSSGARSKDDKGNHRTPGPLQGSVWADPKPSYFPQPHWETDHTAAVGNPHASQTSGYGTEARSGSASNGSDAPSAGSAGGAKISFPPPPSMPPPPAPTVKGGLPKADNSASTSKHYANKQSQFERHTHKDIPNTPTLELPPRHALSAMHGIHSDSAEPLRTGSLDRSNIPLVAPIGPAPTKLQRPAASLLPDQEFIPINTDSPSLERMQVFGDSPFTSSFFASPFASMFGPVTSYGGENTGGASGSGLLADLHADSQPIANATGRHKSESGSQLV